MRASRLIPSLACALVAVGAAACATIIGAEEGTPLPDAGEGGIHDAGPDVTFGGDACAKPGPSAMGAIFVAGDAMHASDSGTCGTQAEPCKTIGQGIKRAQMTGAGTVHVAGPTTYVETITLPGGITIDGGWGFDAMGQWAAGCGEVEKVVVLQGTANVTVQADMLASDARLATLTIASKDAAPGESLYGVMARDGTGTLTLDDVLIEMGKAGAGATGGAGMQGSMGGGGCAAGGGMPGATGTPPGGGATGGTWTRDGYVPGDGVQGVVGGVGDNGTAAPDPPCIDCIKCSGAAVCSQADNGQLCGSRGTNGCGGAGGSGGLGGKGGGSSVAVFAFATHVAVHGGRLHAGNGGNGGDGGQGGKGGDGSRGGPGADSPTTCGLKSDGCALLQLGCQPTTQAHGPAGMAGGDGAPGGVGSQGGGGAGGASFAIVKMMGAVVDVDDPKVLVKSDPGAGGMPNGSPGDSGETKQVP